MSQLDDILANANAPPTKAIKQQLVQIRRAQLDYNRLVRSFTSNPVTYDPKLRGKALSKAQVSALDARYKEYGITELGGGSDSEVYQHHLGKMANAIMKFPRVVRTAQPRHPVNLERDFLGAVSSIVLGKMLPDYFPQTDVMYSEDISKPQGKGAIFFQPFVKGRISQYKTMRHAPEGTQEKETYKTLEKLMSLMGTYPHDPHKFNFMLTDKGVSFIDASRSVYKQSQSALGLFMSVAEKVMTPKQKSQLNAFARQEGIKVRFGEEGYAKLKGLKAWRRGKRGGEFYNDTLGSRVYKRK